MGVRAHGEAKRARQPEVGQLERVVLAVYQQVLRLQVAVQHPAAATGNPCQNKTKPSLLPMGM